MKINIQKPERFLKIFQVYKALTRYEIIVFFGVAICLTLVLMFLFQDVVRPVVAVPLSYIIWRVDMMSRIVPQSYLWYVFVVIGTLILLKSLARPLKFEQKKHIHVSHHAGRVKEWAQLMSYAKKWSYSRWNCAHRVAELASEIIAFQERCPVEQIQERLRNGEQNAEQDIQAYFQAAMTKARTVPPGLLAGLKQRLISQKQHTSLDLDLEIIMSFLEHCMEGENIDENS